MIHSLSRLQRPSSRLALLLALLLALSLLDRKSVV